MHAVNILLKETRFVNFSGRKCCRLCREVALLQQFLRPLLASFFDHNHTCVLLDISALRVQYGIQAFAKFKRPECTRLHFGELKFQNFPGGACPRAPLERRAVGAPDGRYRAHFATILYISRPPLSQNSPSTPGNKW